jgi:hypothetical protein
MCDNGEQRGNQLLIVNTATMHQKGRKAI